MNQQPSPTDGIEIRDVAEELEGDEGRYRPRVGTHRVLFRLDGKTIHVYAVKQRKEAYE